MANFYAEFNKKVNYRAWEDGEYGQGSMEGFNESIFADISREIVATLGDKTRYDIFEIAYYFKKKYGAFRVPAQYFCYYKDTLTDNLTAFDKVPAMEALNPSYDSTEKNITLVIDTVFNCVVRERYPYLEQADKRNEERMRKEEHYTCRHENPIFILGTLDGNSLNSVYLLSGDCAIIDLNHEFYYFYKHS